MFKILINIFLLTMIIMMCSGILAHWETDPECTLDVVQPFTPENTEKNYATYFGPWRCIYLLFPFFLFYLRTGNSYLSTLIKYTYLYSVASFDHCLCVCILSDQTNTFLSVFLSKHTIHYKYSLIKLLIL